jgi:hypothetical protein
MPKNGQRYRARPGTTEPLPVSKPTPKSKSTKKSKKQKRLEKLQRQRVRAAQHATASKSDVPKTKYHPSLDQAALLRGYPSYADYIASPAWSDLHCRVSLAYGSSRCLACGYPFVSLHHITYERVCCELLSDVVPLCVRCHHAVHQRCKTDGIPLGEFPAVIRAVFKWTEEETDQRLARYHELKTEDDHWLKVGATKAKTKLALYDAMERIRTMVDTGTPVEAIAVAFGTNVAEMERFITVNLKPFV